MNPERFGRKPVTPLFPLAKVSLDTAHRSLMYIDRVSSSNEIADYVIDVLNRAPSSIRIFLEVMAAQIPDCSFPSTMYRYGSTIAMDGVYLERLRLIVPPIRATTSDIQDYRAIRDGLVDRNWYDSNDRSLQKLLLDVSSLVKHADSSFSPLVDEFLENENIGKTGRQMLQWKAGFLLGISDGYFPQRFAYERERLMENLD